MKLRLTKFGDYILTQEAPVGVGDKYIVEPYISNEVLTCSNKIFSLCYAHEVPGGFNPKERVIGSTNPAHNLPLLWSPYFFNTIGGISIGVTAPDEHDCVVGYYDNLANCFTSLLDELKIEHDEDGIEVLEIVFSEDKINIIKIC